MTLKFLFAVVLMTIAAPGMAEDRPAANVAPGAIAKPGAVTMLVEATAIYDLAQGRKDALLAIAAARLMAGLSVQTVPRLAKGVDKPAEIPAALTSAAMIDTARDLAKGDDLLMEMVETMAHEAPVSVQSLQLSALSLAPHQSQDVALTFYADAMAELAVLGPGVQVLVADAAGNPICQDQGAGAASLCRFVPAENGGFVVTVTNPTDQPILWVLATN